MKKKIFMFCMTLLLSFSLISCGNSEVKQIGSNANDTSESKTKNIETEYITKKTDIETEYESESEEDIEEETSTEAREIFSKHYTFGNDGIYNVTWLEESDGSLSISHTIRASSKDELALMSLMGCSHLIDEYQDKDNVYFMLLASVNDSDLHYSLDSYFGFVSVEENGDVVNDFPQWVKSLADESVNPIYDNLEVFNSIIDTMDEIADYENTMFQLY